MRTTLDLPDELFRQVKAKAAVEGLSLKELLRRYVEGGLRQPLKVLSGTVKRSPLPIIPRRADHLVSALTPDLQAQLDQEEDLEKLGRSAGR